MTTSENLMRLIKPLLGIGLIALIGGVLFVYFGVFSVAADVPHSRPFHKLMETIRERSIAVRARGTKAPPLNDPALIVAGGEDYSEMCAGCHLQPGVKDVLLRVGMYPQPPDLTKLTRSDPAQTFWIIKHGLKMSAMPAWGATHDDQEIWALVAFLQQLPRLTPAQYQVLTSGGDGMKDKPNNPGIASSEHGG
jgi:mono/diheme cytochrome c family protein